MSETKWTKGPWRISSISPVTTNNSFPTKHPHYEISAQGSALWLAHVLCFSDQNEGTEHEANAQLIASAPMLYEALVNTTQTLRLLLAGVPDYPIDARNEIRQEISEAESALRAARGEK